jgi:tRNA dimethylallyltransferase
MDRNHVRRLTPALRVVVVLGATATGKSALALEIAARFNAEIINADSRYLYRGLDVGTATPIMAERRGVPHHLVDVLDPTETYSLAQFLDDAFGAIEDVAKRGHLPLVAGGTPQYLRALIEGWQTPDVPPNESLRAALTTQSPEQLLERLEQIDRTSAARIGLNQRRLIRALEIHAATGRPPSELRGKESPPYRFLIIGLRRDRESLHQRIAERARMMFAGGLLDEARVILDLDPALPALSSIGYPEARAVVLGELSLDEAIERTIYATNRYVRHQETWFRRFSSVEWYDSSGSGFSDMVFARINMFLSD